MELKNAIVTGGAGSFGMAYAKKLLASGWRVLLVDCNATGLADAKKSLSLKEGDVSTYCMDVRDQELWRELRNFAEQRFQSLDLFVNNAGVAASGSIESTPLENWSWVMNVNFLAYVRGCQTFLPWLKANPSGAHIINVASVAAFYSAPFMGAYSASKAAVVSLSETLFTELMGSSVTVTVVCPYFFESNLFKAGKFFRESEKKVAEIESQTGLTAEALADKTYLAMQKKELYVFTPVFRSHFAWGLKRLLPKIFLRGIVFETRRKLDSLNLSMDDDK